MEKKINAKIAQWSSTFKQDIVNALVNNSKDGEEGTNVAQFVYNYKTLVLDDTDFKKRQRIKNDVPLHERCHALRLIQVVLVFCAKVRLPSCEDAMPR